MNIIFMGTPDFAVVQLRALVDAGHNVQCVLSNPDKPRGRGGELSPPQVKRWALERGLRVQQPATLRDGAILPLLDECKPDVIVVAAYGKILPQYALDYPKYGCVCVHASLLPKYRGAAPINWALINGEAISGVTIMRMDAGVDTGDMILQGEVPIPRGMDAGALHDALAETGAALLLRALRQLEAGTAVFTKQDSCGIEPSYVTKIDNAFCELDFTRPALELEHRIYGLAPYPGAFTRLDGKLIKVFAATALDGALTDEAPGSAIPAGGGIDAACGGGGVLRLLEVQPEGGRRMSCAEFARGKYRGPGMLSGKKFG